MVHKIVVQVAVATTLVAALAVRGNASFIFFQHRDSGWFNGRCKPTGNRDHN